MYIHKTNVHLSPKKNLPGIIFMYLNVTKFSDTLNLAIPSGQKFSTIIENLMKV